MQEYLIICLVALLASAITLFSGFGLGTVLVPAFALFFPIGLAIGLTAIVHFLNNLFKLFLFGKKASGAIVIRFGIPSLVASFAGALVLTLLDQAPAIYAYQIQGHPFSITPVKLIISVLLFGFVFLEIVPKLASMQFHPKHLVAGGLLSGFFGGVSGNQGALRSAFLLKAGLTKETFIATGVVIACMVDVARLAVYSERILTVKQDNIALVGAATAAAFTGTFIGNRLVKKITLLSFRYFVAAMLFIFALLLGAGIL
jgi:uncharacterized membrane protein YfcA